MPGNKGAVFATGPDPGSVADNNDDNDDTAAAHVPLYSELPEYAVRFGAEHQAPTYLDGAHPNIDSADARQDHDTDTGHGAAEFFHGVPQTSRCMVAFWARPDSVLVEARRKHHPGMSARDGETSVLSLNSTDVAGRLRITYTPGTRTWRVYVGKTCVVSHTDSNHDAWAHTLIDVDGRATARRVSLYRDGQRVAGTRHKIPSSTRLLLGDDPANAATVSFAGHFSMDAPEHLGGNHAACMPPFPGSLADVRLYDAVGASSSAVRDVLAQRTPPTASWSFNLEVPRDMAHAQQTSLRAPPSWLTLMERQRALNQGKDPRKEMATPKNPNLNDPQTGHRPKRHETDLPPRHDVDDASSSSSKVAVRAQLQSTAADDADDGKSDGGSTSKPSCGSVQSDDARLADLDLTDEQETRTTPHFGRRTPESYGSSQVNCGKSQDKGGNASTHALAVARAHPQFQNASIRDVRNERLMRNYQDCPVSDADAAKPLSERTGPFYVAPEVERAQELSRKRHDHPSPLEKKHGAQVSNATGLHTRYNSPDACMTTSMRYYVQAEQEARLASMDGASGGGSPAGLCGGLCGNSVTPSAVQAEETAHHNLGVTMADDALHARVQHGTSNTRPWTMTTHMERVHIRPEDGSTFLVGESRSLPSKRNWLAARVIQAHGTHARDILRMHAHDKTTDDATRRILRRGTHDKELATTHPRLHARLVELVREEDAHGAYTDARVFDDAHESNERPAGLPTVRGFHYHQRSRSRTSGTADTTDWVRRTLLYVVLLAILVVALYYAFRRKTSANAAVPSNTRRRSAGDLNVLG